MKNLLFLFVTCLLTVSAQTQNVGIGTTNPLARLHVADSAVLFSATGDIPGTAGNVPGSGAGRRMMWYADKAAFRTGYVPGTEWDKNNIGSYSTALGYGTMASGIGSTAIGYETTASGVISTAMGFQTISKALGSLVIGNNNDDTDTPDPNNPLQTDRIFQIGNGNFSNVKSNAMTILRNGNVGIGLISPVNKLHISTGTVRFEGQATAGGVALSLGGNGDVQVDAVGSAGGRFIIKDNGNVGIGISSPGFPLNFANSPGDKISLLGNSGSHYGFGVQNSLLQIHSATSADDIAFGYGSSGSFTEKFRMKANGAFSINGNTGSAGQVLQSNGSSSSSSWKTLGALIRTYYNYPSNLEYFEGTLTPGSTIVFTALTATITVTTKSRLIISAVLEGNNLGCVGCGYRKAHVDIRINGNEVVPGDFLGIAKIVSDNDSWGEASISNYFYDVNPGTYTIEFIVQGLTGAGDMFIYSKYSTILVLPID